ncbi:MAG: hypothetical protein U0796_15860 [Gemmatales bacterium]
MLMMCMAFVTIGWQEPVAPAKPATAQAAMVAFRAAIEKGDVEAFAQLVAGPPGNLLRTLAPALKKAQVASDAFSKALAEKPALNVTNPLANDFNPLRGYLLELIELVPGKDESLARVRFGPVGRLREETLSVKREGEGFRVSLPSAYLKAVVPMTAEQVNQQVQRLNALTVVFTTISEQVKKGELTSKEAVLVRLGQLVRDAKVVER